MNTGTIPKSLNTQINNISQLHVSCQRISESSARELSSHSPDISSLAILQIMEPKQRLNDVLKVTWEVCGRAEQDPSELG